MLEKKLEKIKRNHIGTNKTSKIIKLMHTKKIKKRLSYMVGSYINKALTLPLARVHLGFVLCLCLNAAISKLTMQILMRTKLHLTFFLCSLCVLKKMY